MIELLNHLTAARAKQFADWGESDPYTDADYQRGLDLLTPRQQAALLEASHMLINQFMATAGDHYENLPDGDLASAIMVIMSNLEV